MVWSYICAAKAEICVYNSRDCEDRGRDIRTPRRGREPDHFGKFRLVDLCRDIRTPRRGRELLPSKNI